MQYLLLIYEGEKRFHNQPKPDFDAELAEYRAFGKEYAGSIKGGNALKPTPAATTVRMRDGKRLTTDGPFAETKEQLGGFWVIRAADLDSALDWAAKGSAACREPVEVRPFQDEAAE